MLEIVYFYNSSTNRPRCRHIGHILHSVSHAGVRAHVWLHFLYLL